MDPSIDVGRRVIASLLTSNGPLEIYTTNALTALVASLPSQCVKPVATRGDKLDGFTITEWAAFASKKSAIASSVARLNGELKAKLASWATDGRKQITEVREHGGDPWALPAERGHSSRVRPTTDKDYGNSWSTRVPSCEPPCYEGMGASASVRPADTERKGENAKVKDEKANLINPELAVINTSMDVPGEDEIMTADVEHKREDAILEDGAANFIVPGRAGIAVPRQDELQAATEVHDQHADMDIEDGAVLDTLQGCDCLAFWTCLAPRLGAQKLDTKLSSVTSMRRMWATSIGTLMRPLMP
jgi:hypothetical protein